MPTLQLHRPLHDILATTMPPGRPLQNQPGGDAPDSGHGSEVPESDAPAQEEEANPS
jgi:hypothetical protein